MRTVKCQASNHFISPTQLTRIKTTTGANLNQLHEVLEVGLFVDGELAIVVHDAVVLHFAVAAHTQGVVAGEVGALPHQEQARFRGRQQALGLVSRDLAVEPPGSSSSTEELSGTGLTLQGL